MRECSLISLTDSTLQPNLNYQRQKTLKLATFGFDFECSYANHTTTSNTDYAKLMNYCMKIAPYT